jgi:prepilin-type N-terminal cleavage/methylation domain-containing protein
MRFLKVLTEAVRKRGSGLKGGQRGYTLVEVIVAVAIVGIIAVAFLSALTSGYLALVLADENTVAESLTRTEFERVREAAYPVAGYDRPDALPGYDVAVLTANVDESDSPIQLITVEVRHDGELLLTTSSYKVDPNKNLPS